MKIKVEQVVGKEEKIRLDLEKFQLEEYKNISNAHFETNKQIGIFFRYFLIIASAPAIIFIWFGGESDFLNELLIGDNQETIKNLFVGFFLIFISIIGTLSCLYLISLKLDSILYARTINGVRKYFFNKNINFEEQYRILPKQTNQPKYRDFHTFGILVYSFALIDSIYFSLGTRIIAGVGNDFFNNYLGFEPILNNYNIWWTIGCFIVIFLSHLLYYRIISNFRKDSYMKSSIIGIDIDGVLNNHRATFCKKHKENMIQQFTANGIPDNKKLNPEDINRIPVNLIDSKEISVNDEYDVFNNPEYWKEQQLISPNVGKVIKELKNSFGYKINIHSYRPWPQYEYGTLLKEDEINKLWGISKRNYWWIKNVLKGQSNRLRNHTESWLTENKIPFNNLYVEKSSIDFSRRRLSLYGIFYNISLGQFKNRFYYTNKKPYRYFIEDTPENAIKLASSCDFVFLIEQPYNSLENYTNRLPTNVIRVKTWSEIKNKIKELG